MIANFVVDTVTEYFEEGTVGGIWEWTLREALDISAVVSWNTVDPIASHEVTEGVEYVIVCRRLSIGNTQLGPAASTQFIAEIAIPPLGVAVQVAKTMKVSLQ